MLIYRKQFVNKELEHSDHFNSLINVPDYLQQQIQRHNNELIIEREKYDLAINEIDIVVTTPEHYALLDGSLIPIKRQSQDNNNGERHDNTSKSEPSRNGNAVSFDRRNSVGKLKQQISSTFNLGEQPRCIHA